MKELLNLVGKVILNPILLGTIALISGIVGVILVFDSPAYADRLARAQQLAPVSAAALADSSPGREVLLEGRISPSNPLVYGEFVAYVREEYRDEFLDGDSTQRWVEAARATPPLLVALPDGEARIANDNYIFDTTAVTIEEAAPTITKGAVQARGYVVGSPLVAIGSVAADGSVKAEFLYAGTRADYMAEMRRVSARSLPIGLVFLLVGTLSTVGCVWQLRRVLREIAAETAAEEAAQHVAEPAERKRPRKGRATP